MSKEYIKIAKDELRQEERSRLIAAAKGFLREKARLECHLEYVEQALKRIEEGTYVLPPSPPYVSEGRTATGISQTGLSQYV